MFNNYPIATLATIFTIYVTNYKYKYQRIQVVSGYLSRDTSMAYKQLHSHQVVNWVISYFTRNNLKESFFPEQLIPEITQYIPNYSGWAGNIYHDFDTRFLYEDWEGILNQYSLCKNIAMSSAIFFDIYRARDFLYENAYSIYENMFPLYESALTSVLSFIDDVQYCLNEKQEVHNSISGISEDGEINKECPSYSFENTMSCSIEDSDLLCSGIHMFHEGVYSQLYLDMNTIFCLFFLSQGWSPVACMWEIGTRIIIFTSKLHNNDKKLLLTPIIDEFNSILKQFRDDELLPVSKSGLFSILKQLGNEFQLLLESDEFYRGIKSISIIDDISIVSSIINRIINTDFIQYLDATKQKMQSDKIALSDDEYGVCTPEDFFSYDICLAVEVAGDSESCSDINY